MNVKQVGSLAVIALFAVSLTALAFQTGPQGVSSDRRGQQVFPGLVQKVNDVASVTIRDHEKTFTVERGKDGFFNKESGYTVKPEAFRDLVVGASMLAFEEGKTADPARYGELGLAAPGAAPETVGREVTLRDAGGNVLATLTAGNRDTTVGGARGGTYILTADKKQGWLVRGEVQVPVPHTAWFEINLINIGRDALAGITLKGGGLDEVIMASDKKGDDLKVVNLPEDRQSDSGKLMRLSFMVDPISFQDVRKAVDAPAPDARTMVVTSRNGLKITYTTIGALADGWVRFTVEATDDAGKTEAEEFRKKTDGYDFKLAAHEIEMLGWGMKDLTSEPKS